MQADRPSFVAVFDILGFSRLVARSELPTLVTELRLLFRDDHLESKFIAFSDTIVLYTEGDEPEKLRTIVEDSVLLLGLFADQGKALRGAISHGEFYCDDTVFAGKAMIRAYELEQSQDWLGAIVDPLITHTRDPAERYSEVLKQLKNDALAVPHERRSCAEQHALHSMAEARETVRRQAC